MFDSVLWYVQKYVDATSFNNFVNGIFSSVGINLNWKFDIEHVTVINAGTIILLQIVVSNIVKTHQSTSNNDCRHSDGNSWNGNPGN